MRLLSLSMDNDYDDGDKLGVPKGHCLIPIHEAAAPERIRSPRLKSKIQGMQQEMAPRKRSLIVPVTDPISPHSSTINAFSLSSYPSVTLPSTSSSSSKCVDRSVLSPRECSYPMESMMAVNQRLSSITEEIRSLSKSSVLGKLDSLMECVQQLEQIKKPPTSDDQTSQELVTKNESVVCELVSNQRVLFVDIHVLSLMTKLSEKMFSNAMSDIITFTDATDQHIHQVMSQAEMICGIYGWRIHQVNSSSIAILINFSPSNSLTLVMEMSGLTQHMTCHIQTCVQSAQIINMLELLSLASFDQMDIPCYEAPSVVSFVMFHLMLLSRNVPQIPL